MSLKMKYSNVDWIGDIPDDWEMRKIKYILSERNEKNNPLKSKNILSLTAYQGVIPYSEKKGGGNKPKGDLTKYKLAYPNDIVMNSMNILSGSVGLSKHYGCVSPVYYMFFADDKSVNIKYYNYLFQTKVFQKSLLGLGNGILIKKSSNGKLNTIRMRISSEKINNLFMPFPNQKIQTNIVKFLDSKVSEINAAIFKTEETIEKYEEYKQSLITEIVTTGLNKNVELVESHAPWMPLIPKHWKIAKFKFHLKADENKGYPDLQVLSLYRDYGVIPKDSRDDNYNVTSEDTSNYKHIVKGNFVVNKMKAWQGSVAVSEYEGIVSPAYYVYKFISNEFNFKYFHYLIRNKSYTPEFRRLSGGIREGQWDLSRYSLENILILIPPLNEQNDIVRFLNKKCDLIDSIIIEKKQLIDKLEEYKQSLIFEYVTGKKEVPK